MAGCGIEEYAYFYRPTVSSDPVLSVTPLEFSHNVSNQDSSSFLGYEIYYLLIDAENVTFLESVRSKIDVYIGSKTPGEMIKIITDELGFVSLVGIQDLVGTPFGGFPLFLVNDPSVDVDFQVFIGELGTVSVSGTDTSGVSAPIAVRRNSTDADGLYRTFANLQQDDYKSGGDTAYLTEEPGIVLFKAYIVAYGLFGNNFTQVYSDAVKVGYYTSDIDYGVVLTGGAYGP